MHNLSFLILSISSQVVIPMDANTAVSLLLSVLDIANLYKTVTHCY